MYVINGTVRTMTRTHSRSTWSLNIQNSQHKQVQKGGARKGFVCGKCSMYCSTVATFKIHIATHKKTPCPFCPQKFYDAASWNKHVSVKHSDRCDRKLNCRLAPDCKEMFNNMKELGIHSRQAHRDMYPFRCNYKDCFDCYRTIDGLVKHSRTHGKETWDATHHTEDKKDQYKCSLCKEMFDLVAQLLSHTQVHEENKYKSDECDWHFYLIAGLTCHGQDCHDTRHHACMWCVEYFNNVDELHRLIRRKHHFECTICYDVSPTAEELEEHSKEKHGGLQPGEQELQIQRCREEKLEQSERRKEKAKEEAKQTTYFPCKECVEGFKTKRELDTHMMDKHIFVCGECLRMFKIKAEKDHKGMSTEMTKQEKLLAEEWHKKKRTDEPRRHGRRCGQSMQPRRNSRWLKKRKRRKRSLQLHRPKKRQNMPRAMTEMMTKITSPQKNQAARTHCTSQPKRSSEEPTRKAISELYFYVFSLADQKTNTIHVHSYFFCRF